MTTEERAIQRFTEIWQEELNQFCDYKVQTQMFGELTILEVWLKDRRQKVKDKVDGWVKQYIEEKNYKHLTELVLLLNHKIWQFYGKKDEEMSGFYNTLWEETENKFHEVFGSDTEAERYFFQITD